ncbi:hypothetical protein WJX84_008069 [Apatococcus fuscideae]|uniref:Structural maintenance of chromosomes protein n=1 Tax=Apatococcus fuscideae TaxID=2026836 RepID=A0AAW1TAX0_9CHLO
MHIKQVVIEGFKSYKDQIAVEPFSHKINAVVGANGSGKSNFFSAIRFVISDMSAPGPEERQKLLHEGAGHAVLSAYVEIIFNNSDNRLPVDKEEVRLRRTISVKKDEYSLDRKHITKTEVVNLLESAGFSRANPYYVVQQGKIMAMTTMKDHERLDLLKEIGGTKVYEERRKESLNLMQETETRRQRINEVVKQLEFRLKELDEERAELAQYQQIDKQRRSLEYAIYDKEISDIRSKLEQIEGQRQKENDLRGEHAKKQSEEHSRLKRIAKDLRALSDKQADLATRLTEAQATHQQAIKKHAQSELDLQELLDSAHKSHDAKAHFSKQLDQLLDNITAKQREYDQVKADLDACLAESGRVSQALATADRKLQALFTKQGRTTQFKTEQERDEFVRKEIVQLEATIARKQQSLTALTEETQQLNSQLMELSQSVGDKDSVIRAKGEELSRDDRRCAELVQQRDRLQDQRKRIWRGMDDVDRSMAELRSQAGSATRHFEQSVARDINKSLLAVQRTAKNHNISGVNGTVIELLTCEKHFHTAVEVTAGNSLFNIVVDTDGIATQLSGIMNREKSGRATFMPLNRLNPDRVSMPEDLRANARPIIEQIKFDPKYEKAMQQVFGKTLLCKDLDVANAAAHRTHLNCVTMGGDQVSKKGSITGGFRDLSRSKMDAMHQMKASNQKVHEADLQRQSQQEDLDDVDQQIATLMGETQKLEAKRTHHRQQLEGMRSDLSAAQKRQKDLQGTVEAKEARASDIQANVRGLQDILQETQSELGTPLDSQLTTEERHQLRQLQEDIRQLQEEERSERQKMLQAETKQASLQELLDSNLLKRKEELEAQIAAANQAADGARLQAHRAEAANTEAAKQGASSDAQGLEKELEDISGKLKKLQADQEKLTEKEQADTQLIQDEQRTLEQMMAKRSGLQQKKGDLEKKIREMGTLPADAFEKYRDRSPKELHKLLHKCQGQLSKYGSVNQKALDQYVNFTEQREELTQRQTENSRGEAKIKQLIQTLDLRKDEAIERTFKGVAKNFREIFGELAPGGREELGEDADEDLAEAAPAAGLSEKYSGVKVKISFGAGDIMSMKQLSGGQKTLVALALIFAIQRCDPAPFYLFDEIDAALDPQYRTTVANMLARQANDPQNPAQFIITTFHPQLLHETDKVYGVSHCNRISRVDVVTKQDALEFIQSEEDRQKQGAKDNSS